MDPSLCRLHVTNGNFSQGTRAGFLKVQFQSKPNTQKPTVLLDHFSFSLFNFVTTTNIIGDCLVCSL